MLKRPDEENPKTLPHIKIITSEEWIDFSIIHAGTIGDPRWGDVDKTDNQSLTSHHTQKSV